MIHVPCAKVSVACLLVTFLARESESLIVAGDSLVNKAFAKWQVLQVLHGCPRRVGNPARTAKVVAMVVIHLGTLTDIGNLMHRTDKLTVFRPDGHQHLFRYRLKGNSQLLDIRRPIHDAVHVIRFKHPTVHLGKALAEQPVGPRVETVGVRQIEAHIQAAVPYAGGNALYARKGGRVLYAVFFHHQLYNEEVCVLLPLMLFRS